MALEEIRESYYRLEQDYIKQKELLTKVEARVRELEETQRWRKWPHEKPTETGCHMVRLPGKCFTMTGYWNCFEEWDLKYERFYWMPQIPLPGGE